ncbi:unnamed protein product, partial [Bubo scandiacus]
YIVPVLSSQVIVSAQTREGAWGRWARALGDGPAGSGHGLQEPCTALCDDLRALGFVESLVGAAQRAAGLPAAQGVQLCRRGLVRLPLGCDLCFSPQASRDTFCACADFLEWVRLTSLVMSGQTHLLGECLIAYNCSRVEKYLNQSLLYLENPQATVREAAVRFIGLAVQHVGILSQERLWEICHALQPLEKDAEPSVSSLAAQTTLILKSREQKPRSRWSLWSLCCWPCRALAR